MVWTLEKAAVWARDKLKEAQIKTFRLDVDILLSHVINRTRDFVFTYPEHIVSHQNMNLFKQLVLRRENREPIHYILSYREFWSLDFFVDRNVLIPRPETEHLVDRFLDLARDLKSKQSSLDVLDIGVGSGNITISILKELPWANVTAIDISVDALKVAKRNAKHHNVLSRVNFCEGDLFPDKGLFPNQFDFILSNPPYIAAGLFKNLEPEITHFEPKVALISGQSGLEVYERLITGTLSRLKPGGFLILEIGDDQLELVKKLVEESGGFDDFFCACDYAGSPRTISARRKYNG